MLRMVAQTQRLGNSICGLCYLEVIGVQPKRGRVLDDTTPLISQPKPGVVPIVAIFGFAQSALAAGLPVALAAAKQNGVVNWVVGHAHTCTFFDLFYPFNC